MKGGKGDKEVGCGKNFTKNCLSKPWSLVPGIELYIFNYQRYFYFCIKSCLVLSFSICKITNHSIIHNDYFLLAEIFGSKCNKLSKV